MTMGLLVAGGHSTDRFQHIVREGTIHIYASRPTSFFGQLGPLGLGAGNHSVHTFIKDGVKAFSFTQF